MLRRARGGPAVRVGDLLAPVAQVADDRAGRPSRRRRAGLQLGIRPLALELALAHSVARCPSFRDPDYLRTFVPGHDSGAEDRDLLEDCGCVSPDRGGEPEVGEGLVSEE